MNIVVYTLSQFGSNDITVKVSDCSRGKCIKTTICITELLDYPMIEFMIEHNENTHEIISMTTSLASINMRNLESVINVGRSFCNRTICSKIVEMVDFIKNQVNNRLETPPKMYVIMTTGISH